MRRITLEQKLVLYTSLVLLAVAVIVRSVYQVDLPPPKLIDLSGQPEVGNRFAPVNIVMFLDPKCPNCCRFHQEVYPDIQDQYITTNLCKGVIFPLAFLAGSRPAGNALLEVYHQKPDLFISYLEELFDHQGDEDEDWCTAELLKSLAEEVPGLDPEEVAQAVRTARYSAALDHSLAVAMEVMQPVLTPSVFVEGVPATHPSFEAIEDLVERTLDAYGVH